MRQPVFAAADGGCKFLLVRPIIEERWMMKIVFLDVYRKSRARISKDVAGGYGTENVFGDGVLGKALTGYVKRAVSWPNVSFVQLMTEFVAAGYQCAYVRAEPGAALEVPDADIYFVCASIVCFETEIAAIEELAGDKPGSKVVYCGEIGRVLIDQVPDQCTVLSGNYDFLLQHLAKRGMGIEEMLAQRHIAVENGDPDRLSGIDWLSGAYGLVRNRLYATKGAYIPFRATRGCSNSCYRYCVYPLSQGRLALHETVDSVVSKLKKYDRPDVRNHVVFRDPSFAVDMEYAKCLLQAIIDEPMNLDFSVELHLKDVDDEFIELSRRASVKWMKFGVESASARVRNSVDRISVSNDELKDRVDRLKSAGIKTVAMYILCQPKDTPQTIANTVGHAKYLGTDVAHFSIFTPYPGTPYYNANEAMCDFQKYEEVNQFSLVYRHENFSAKQARAILQQAYLNTLVHKYAKISIPFLA